MQMEIIAPYRNESLNRIYNMLFCDMPECFGPEDGQETAYPWNILFSPNPPMNDLHNVIEDADSETRIKILAYNLLANAGYPVQKKELLGVIIEVGLDDGLDVLAAYEDGTARYINQSEKIIIWESPNADSQQLVGQLLDAGLQIVQRIGPWNKERLPQPATGEVRLTFLVSDGLYFGQGPFNALAQDAMGGPVIEAGYQLMSFLTGAQ
jgi:hypothetical protein